MESRLFESLVAASQSMREQLDPQRFLEAFSTAFQPLVPHDRLVIDDIIIIGAGVIGLEYDLTVDGLEDLGPLVDHGHLDTERGHHRGVSRRSAITCASRA